MLELKDKCVKSDTGEPYILSSQGGLDNSPEGLQVRTLSIVSSYPYCTERSSPYLGQDGITHAFVVGFETAEDRDYYVKEDPAHQEFIKSVRDLLVKSQVLDSIPGIF